MSIRCGIIPLEIRFDGYAHHYWYALDEEWLNEAAKHYVGSHDFTSFVRWTNAKWAIWYEL